MLVSIQLEEIQGFAKRFLDPPLEYEEASLFSDMEKRRKHRNNYDTINTKENIFYLKQRLS